MSNIALAIMASATLMPAAGGTTIQFISPSTPVVSTTASSDIISTKDAETKIYGNQSVKVLSTSKVDGKDRSYIQVDGEKIPKWVDSSTLSNFSQVVNKKSENTAAFIKDKTDIDMYENAPAKTSTDSINSVAKTSTLANKELTVVASADVKNADGQNQKYSQIKVDNKSYWVDSSSLISKADKTAQLAATAGTSIVKAAQATLGIPYVYGGTSLDGFDCSGFVQYVLAISGQPAIGRTTTEQAATLRAEGHNPKSISEAQPGDIIFWGGIGDEYHVEVYIGNGQSIGETLPGTVSEARAVWGSPVAYSTH